MRMPPGAGLLNLVPLLLGLFFVLCVHRDRRTVQKGCGLEYEDSECQQTGLGSKWTSRCVCDQPLCNGDAALIASGLEPPADDASALRSSLPVLVGSLFARLLLNF
ncbi:hypothetical protein QR680_009703 [Steinernema hermaphroditum]|uniref:Uncharacterized protein n=1 Tax=Steinernema hermaphroditum TaxID=289476 RepID=A0AA39ILC8_9BILA|nr:hypothetical protein QR680_009703 [Steinernema hermaphroditum]